jgi:hypothetical protein
LRRATTSSISSSTRWIWRRKSRRSISTCPVPRKAAIRRGRSSSTPRLKHHMTPRAAARHVQQHATPRDESSPHQSSTARLSASVEHGTPVRISRARHACPHQSSRHACPHQSSTARLSASVEHGTPVRISRAGTPVRISRARHACPHQSPWRYCCSWAPPLPLQPGNNSSARARRHA